jgi:hypothetical protein
LAGLLGWLGWLAWLGWLGWHSFSKLPQMIRSNFFSRTDTIAYKAEQGLQASGCGSAQNVSAMSGCAALKHIKKT